MTSGSSSWPPTLLRWVLGRWFQEQRLEMAGHRVLWRLHDSESAISIAEEGNECARVSFFINWPRALDVHADAGDIVLSLGHVSAAWADPDSAHRRDLDRRIARLREWTSAVGRRLGDTLAPLFPRTEAELIDWGASPLGSLGQDAAPVGVDRFERLGDLGCDLSCCFCTRSEQEGDDAPPRLHLMEQLYHAAHALGWAAVGSHRPSVTIGGDEPLRHPDLVSLVRLVTHRGFRAVLQTNAMARVTPSLARDLQREGLAAVRVPVYGATAATHDAVVGVEGHFVQLWAAVETLQAEGIELLPNSVALELNREELPALLELCEGRMGGAVPLEYPRDEGASRIPVAEQMERLSTLPQEVKNALALRIPCLGINARPGDPHGNAEGVEQGQGQGQGPNSAESRSPADEAQKAQQREYAPVCGRCRLRPLCGGLPIGYLARFGDGELLPVR